MDSREDDVTLAENEGIGFDLLSDPGRETISSYGVADAGPEIAMPAVFIVRTDGVIAWRAVGDSMRDLPPVETVLQAATNAAAAAPATEAPAATPAPEEPPEPATSTDQPTEPEPATTDEPAATDE